VAIIVISVTSHKIQISTSVPSELPQPVMQLACIWLVLGFPEHFARLIVFCGFYQSLQVRIVPRIKQYGEVTYNLAGTVG
jgi:hypothetical protein